MSSSPRRGPSFSSLPKRAVPFRPTWCKRAFKSRHPASRQSRQTHGTRDTTPGTAGSAHLRARCLHRFLGRGPFVPVTTTPCPPARSLPPTLHPRGRTAAPHSPVHTRARARATGASRRDRGGTFGSLSSPSLSHPPPSVPRLPTPHTRALERVDYRSEPGALLPRDITNKERRKREKERKNEKREREKERETR